MSGGIQNQSRHVLITAHEITRPLRVGRNFLGRVELEGNRVRQRQRGQDALTRILPVKGVLIPGVSR